MLRLSDLKIRALPLPKRGQKTWWDDLPGFGVRVSQGGAKTFILMHGRARTMTTIGRAGIITLAEARQRARELLAERTLGRSRAVSHLSFAAAIDQFLETHDCKASTREKYRTLFERHFLAKLRHEQLDRIHTIDLTRIIDRLRNRPAEASQTYAAASVLFNWAKARRLIERSPLEGVPRPYQGDPRDRVLTHDEIRAIFAVEEPLAIANIIKLILLTGQRPAQIGALEREWIAADTIHFPAAIMKNGKPHQIPFGDMTGAILEKLPQRALLFPNRKGAPFSSWPGGKLAFDIHSSVQNYTIHDCRRTFATLMAEIADPIIVERFLSHNRTLAGVAGIYNRFNYLAPMRAAIQAYEARLQALISKEESTNGRDNADVHRIRA